MTIAHMICRYILYSLFIVFWGISLVLDFKAKRYFWFAVDIIMTILNLISLHL